MEHGHYHTHGGYSASYLLIALGLHSLLEGSILTDHIHSNYIPNSIYVDGVQSIIRNHDAKTTCGSSFNGFVDGTIQKQKQSAFACKCICMSLVIGTLFTLII